MTAPLRAWSSRHIPDMEAARRKLEKMPPADNGRGVAVPFPYKDRSGYKTNPTRSNTELKQLIESAPVKKIPIAGLHAIQHSVKPQQVLNYVRKPDMVPEGARDPIHGGPIDKPIVVEKAGVRYIYDGHHRITADLLRGKRETEARYVDLDSAGERL